jgi:hypothetical protein
VRDDKPRRKAEFPCKIRIALEGASYGVKRLKLPKRISDIIIKKEYPD